MGIVADVMEVQQVEGGKLVTVELEVTPPTRISAGVARARARALMAAGPFNAIEKGLNDIRDGEVNRLTEVTEKNPLPLQDQFMRVREEYKILVKST